MTKVFRIRILLAAATVLLATGAVPVQAFQLSARPAAEWVPRLESSTRIADLKLDEILERLDLKLGMVIADVGSGSGVFSRPLAKAVGPVGKVYAVDIQSDLLSYVSERAQKEGIDNIITHLAPVHDARLPGPILDLAFFHDSLHHMEPRETYFKNLAKYMKPDGRIVVIELDINDPEGSHRNQPELQVAREDLNKWLTAVGFHQVEEHDLFPGKKWFVVYARQ